MARFRKIDNHNLPAKLDLRRYFLAKYHSDGQARVMDCCQGGGVLWETLRREFAIASYFGLDTKPKQGRLKIQSERVLSQPGWRENVIDVDTWGNQFKHWFAMLPNIARPTTVFLTVGQVNAWGGVGAVGKLSAEAKTALGISFDVPSGFTSKLNIMALPHLLSRAAAYGIEIVEAIEADNGRGSARYVGVRLAVSR